MSKAESFVRQSFTLRFCSRNLWLVRINSPAVVTRLPAWERSRWATAGERKLECWISMRSSAREFVLLTC